MCRNDNSNNMTADANDARTDAGGNNSNLLTENAEISVTETLEESNEETLLPTSMEEDGGKRSHLQELDELNSFLEDLEEKIRAKKQLRLENMQRELPDDDYFAKLDSNLKRNTAFVKKLRQFTAAQMENLLKDMSSLNLTKYISEICSALVEAKFKMTDVPAVVSLCSRLHQTYGEFHQELLEAWHKLLILKQGEKYSNPSKLRVDIRLYAELVSSGVISCKPGLSLLGNALMHIIGQDKEDHSNLSIILSFCRHCGEEYAGLVPRKILELTAKFEGKVIPKSDFLTPDKQHNLKNLLKEYYKNFCKYLANEHSQLINMKNNLKISMASKGNYCLHFK